MTVSARMINELRDPVQKPKEPRRGPWGGSQRTLKKVDPKRIWDQVDKENAPIHPVHGQCWQWFGYRMKCGYGFYNGLIHRRVYIALVGSIPVGICVLHKCDNRSCVNPAHLELGTQTDNLADMRRKKRHVRGEKFPQAKLTEDDVREMRRKYPTVPGYRSPKKLAAEFKIAASNVRKIVAGKRWRHVV